MTKGLHEHRFRDNPEEERFAKAWRRHNSPCGTIEYLLDPYRGARGRPGPSSDRDYVVAATVIQWLGSPVGQGFLRDLGYERK